MECEICGSESGKLVQIFLEGARVMACQFCAEMGQTVKQKPPALERSSVSFYERTKRLEEGDAVVEDFGSLVRKAREKRGLTREELAKKIFEKASVVHRIEAGNYVPDDKTIGKLEQSLGLKLRE